jgi:hypothetical protein
MVRISPSVFGRNLQCQPVRGVDTREVARFKRAGVGTNGILEFKFLSKHAHRTSIAVCVPEHAVIVRLDPGRPAVFGRQSSWWLVAEFMVRCSKHQAPGRPAVRIRVHEPERMPLDHT